MTQKSWPIPLEDGETLIAQGRPSPMRRAKETLMVAIIAGTVHTMIELYQQTFVVLDLVVFLAVLIVVYTVFNLYFRKGDDWMLTDQRVILRRGSSIRAADVASVTAQGDSLKITSTGHATWRIEPLENPEATARRLNWGAR